jgi:hypothetical protein
MHPRDFIPDDHLVHNALVIWISRDKIRTALCTYVHDREAPRNAG